MGLSSLVGWIKIVLVKKILIHGCIEFLILIFSQFFLSKVRLLNGFKTLHDSSPTIVQGKFFGHFAVYYGGEGTVIPLSNGPFLRIVAS